MKYSNKLFFLSTVCILSSILFKDLVNLVLFSTIATDPDAFDNESESESKRITGKRRSRIFFISIEKYSYIFGKFKTAKQIK